MMTVPLPPLAPATKSKPLVVRCGSCAQVWPALYLPMDLGKVSKILKGMRCPKCASPSRDHFMASETDLVRFQEQQHG